MKKQESGNKTIKWLIPVVIVALLAIIGLVVFFAFGGESDTPQQTEATTPTQGTEGELVLYWNVDRTQYVAAAADGISTGRLPRSDGYYYVRFAVGGEQIDLPVADRTLVERIDMLDIMSLVFDENGVVVDIRTVADCTGGTLAPTLFVENVEGNKIYANTQGTYDGLPITFEINENTQVYNVGGVGLLIGIPGQIAFGDEVVAIKDYDGNIIYVFIKPYIPPADIYWNIHRKYDSTLKMTTRESSVTGVYEFEMACNGEKVIVRTKDPKVANSIDSKAAKWQALEFDEDGYVITSFTSGSYSKISGTFASWTRVMETDGTYVRALKIGGDKDGTIYEDYINENTKIIDVSQLGGYSGAYTTLRYGDLIHGLYDQRGRLSHIFVIERLGDYPLYWNCERQYDSTLKSTKRIPAADGYYYFDVATGGEQIRVRTNDKAIADKLDSYAARCFGMSLDGDVIKELYGASTVHGGSTFGSWYYVDKLDGNKITVKRILTGDTVPTYMEGELSKDVEIINGSTNYSSHCGEYSSLAVGDRVHCLKDLQGKVRVVFIVDKPVDCKVYWNLTRMYNSTTKQTTRVPDEDGYYWFKLAVDGQQIKAKTKDKALATKIDANAARCSGMEVYNGIIYKVHGVGSVRGLSGGTKSMSWVNVISANQYSFTAQKNQAGHKDDGKVFTSSIGWGCKIINTTSGYKSHMGEYTDLRVGDTVHVLHDGDGNAKYIFIVGGRQPELNTSAEDCPCGQNPAWEPWDGTTELEDGKYYYLTADVEAPAEGFIIEGKAVALRLDGHTISGPGRLFYGKSGGQLSICDHTGNGKLIADGVEGEPGGAIRMYTNSGDAYFKLWNVEITHTGANKPTQGGLVSSSGIIKFFNCNIHDGTCSQTGGNLHINPTGMLYLFDSTVSGGTSTGNGGNLHIGNGAAYIENSSFIDGQSGGKSDNINIGTDKDVFFNGVTVTNSDTKGGSGVNFSKGTVRLAGNIQICDNGKNNLIMGSEAVFVNEGLDAASRIVVQAGEQDLLTGAATDLSGCFVSYDENDYVTVYDSENKKVVFDCIITPKTHEVDHCACAGIGAIGDHTCQTLTGWTQITDAVFEDAMGTNGKSQGVKFINDGNYYLTLDYQLPGQLNIMPGQNITICLNGCDLTRSGRVAMVAGNLNITDCKGGGIVSGADIYNGGTVKIVSGGTLNLFAGTLTCDAAADTGGVVNVTQDKGYIAPADSTELGVFNMYGGAVKDGVSNGGGGNINIWHSAVMNLYGGTVSGGTAGANGGNIAVAGSGAKLNLYGGTVTGGTAGKNGDGIFLNKNAVTLANDTNISGNNGEDLFIGEGSFALDNYTATDVVSVAMSAPGVFADSATDLSARFESAVEDLEVVWKNGQLKLALSSSAEGHIHCVCGGSAEGMYQHECENVLFEPWSDPEKLPTSGYYYLTCDVTLQSVHQVGANSLNLCLHGHKITAPNSRLFHMNSASSYLTVTDCQGTGSLQAAGTADGNGGGVIRNGNATSQVNLYNIAVTRCDDPANRVEVKEGGLISCSGILNMYNVKASNGYATNGGGVLAVLTAKVVIVNSQITDCTSVNSTGGCLRIAGNNTSNKVSVTLIDTTVSGGKATSEYGKDVYIYDSSKNDLYLGGKTVIGDLCMSTTGNVHVLDMGLTTDASIGLSMTTPGKIGTCAADASAAFKPKDTSLTVAYDPAAKTLTLKTPAVAHAAHCVCAGIGAIGDHTCTNVTEWTQITADVFEDAAGTRTNADGSARVEGIKFIEDGNYFLGDDYALPSQLCIMPGQNITICLNGYSITRNGGKPITCAGSLIITDCVGTGTISGGSTEDNSVVLKVVRGANVEMFAGTLTANNQGTTKFGGVLGVSMDSGYITTSTADSHFTLYGGTITGGDADQYGGNISVWGTGSRFTMYGGTVTGGKAGTNGGNMSYTSGGELQLLGGTITGGTAAGNGDSVYVSKADVRVGGDFTGTVYLMENVEIIPDNLTGKVTVEMAVPGVFATGIETDISGKFSSGNAGYDVFYDSDLKVLTLKAQKVHADHCVCGGSAQGVGDHTECQGITWTPISQALAEAGMTMTTASFDKLPSGNYYLDGDVNVTYASYIGGTGAATPGTPANLVICLNGFDITTTDTTTKRVFGRIYDGSSVTITDCSGTEDAQGNWTWGGTVTGGKAANGPILYTYEKGVVNIYGGNFRGPADHTTTGTGLFSIAMDKGESTNMRANAAVLNLYNGSIVATSGKDGTAINVMHAATINMYGGTVQGGTATRNGGAICMGAQTTGNFQGGTVIDGTAADLGDGIYAGSTSTSVVDLTVGGSFKGNIYLTSYGKLKTGTVIDGADIGVEMATVGVFAEDVQTDLSDYFHGVNGEETVYDASAKTLALKVVVHEDHCICQGAEVASIAGHTCENVTWTALTQEMFDSPDGVVVTKTTTDGGSSQDYVLADGGHYYLAEDITLDGTLTPTTGKSFSLCLNGKTLCGTESVRTMFFKGTINLCDCQYTDTADGRVFEGELTGKLNNYAPVFYVRAGATLNVFSGNIKGNTLTAASKTGGMAYVGGTMNIYGGKLYGGTATGNGGNLLVLDGATVNMYGGLITGGAVASGKNGGNIRIDKGFFKLYGGTVSGGNGNEGGNIAIGSNGTVELHGGIVENGTANSGGNIACYGKLLVTGDAILRNGVAKTSAAYGGGGNIYTYANKTNVTISGGTVSGGSAHQGANIYMRTDANVTAPLTITGGTVSGVAEGATGKSIMCNSVGTIPITVGGDAVIDEIHLNGRTLTVDAAGFKAGAAIGVSMATPGKFAAVTDASFDYTAVFTSVDDALKVTQTDTELKLESK